MSQFWWKAFQATVFVGTFAGVVALASTGSPGTEAPTAQQTMMMAMMFSIGMTGAATLFVGWIGGLISGRRTASPPYDPYARYRPEELPATDSRRSKLLE